MKKIFSLFILMLLAMQTMQAQEHVAFGPLHSADSPREDWILPGDTVYQNGKPMIYSGKPLKNPNLPALSEPSKLSDAAKLSEPMQPSSMNQFLGLHKGLNMQVDLSAFATFGKHVPHRGGFTQTIDAAYLTPLTKDNRLWLALGAYINNVNYGGDSYHDGGVYGMLGYKINDHWEAYVYGQLSVANNYNTLYGRYGGYGYGPWGYGGMYPWGYGRGWMPGYGMMGGYGMGAPGANVLGAGIRYTNTSKTFSLGINIEGAWYNNHTPSYYKQYDYPVPDAPRK